MMEWWWSGARGWDGHGFGTGGALMMVAFWIFVVLSIALLIRCLSNQRPHDKETKSDISEILKTRYAKGEIDKTEYEEKKKDLGIE